MWANGIEKKKKKDLGLRDDTEERKSDMLWLCMEFWCLKKKNCLKKKEKEKKEENEEVNVCIFVV